ncbi:hypothetical protein R2F61_08110 [Mollicutes bacterium LVI A0078]|nr:hypothetical protein RZE84_07885 [Mollicutes bacterium LVI A0075]WOO90677.1 hypothetical protein R2F61_08110 [Mollicutes bacterium LVI A0078]
MRWLYNETLTDTEKTIANVILEKSTCIEFITVGAIAKLAYVSPSTVIKYVKKIGFENFGELKEKIQSEANVNKTNDNTYSNLQTKIDFLLTNLAANPNKITSIYHAINNADYIILFGADSSIPVLEYIAPRLREVSQKPIMLHTDSKFLDIEIKNKSNNLILFVSPCMGEPLITSRLELARQEKTTTWTVCETIPTIEHYQNIITLSNDPCTSYSCNYLCNRTLYFIYFELLIDHFKLQKGLPISYQ